MLRRVKRAPWPPLPPMVSKPKLDLALAVAADIVAFFTRSESLRSTGRWALMGAALGGTVSVLGGVYDMRRLTLEEEVHQRVHRHMKVGFALLTSVIGLTIWRWLTYVQADRWVSATYLDCAILTMALACFQGWLGGEVVYSDGIFVKHAHRSPVADGKGAPEEPAKAHHH